MINLGGPMRYRLGFSSNKDSSSVYIECSNCFPLPLLLSYFLKIYPSFFNDKLWILVPFFVLVVPAILSCAASMMNLNWMLSSITLQRKALSSMT